MSALKVVLNKYVTSNQIRSLSLSSVNHDHHHLVKPIKVLVAGAAGQIGYSILPRIARGDIWGKDKPVTLKMLDLPATENIMHGVRMELEDCAFKALNKVEVHTKPDVAYSDCDVIVMLANSMVLTADMTRAELLKENLKVYTDIANSIRHNPNKNFKLLMIANPANTNCLFLIEKLKGVVPPENLTCLTRLDHNRTKAMVAEKLGVPNHHLRKIIVWGNHSATMYPDLRFAEVKAEKGWVKVTSLLTDQEWIKNTFVPAIRTRVSAVIKARGKSSSLSAASAGIDHLRDWLVGTEKDDWVSMGVFTNPIYDSIGKGLVFGQPCTSKDGVFKVVPGLEIDDQTRQMMEISTKELIAERDSIL